MAEVVVYRKDPVLISSARVTIGSSTYALANITSVHTRYTFPFAGFGVACILASAYFVYRAIVMHTALAHQQHSAAVVQSSYLYLAAGIGLLAGGVWLRFFLRKFTLVFNSLGRDVQVLATYSASYVDELAYAVKKAIVTRG